MSAAPPHPTAAPFRHTVRVYGEDSGGSGVVFYGNDLKLFEHARTEWLRQLGVGHGAPGWPKARSASAAPAT